MMMMLVPADHFIRPLQRRLIHKRRRLRSTIDADAGTVPVASAGHLLFAIRKTQQCRFTFAHYHAVDLQLGQRCARRAGAMRTDSDQHGCGIPQSKC